MKRDIHQKDIHESLYIYICIYMQLYILETPSPLLLSSCTEQNISDLLCHLIQVALLAVHGARQS